MGLHLLIVLVCLRVVTFIYPVPIYTKDILNHTCFHPWQPSHLKHEPTNLQRMSTHIPTHISAFFQNHERVSISPIAPKGEVPKPWEGPYFPYFPYFGGPCLVILSRHGPPIHGFGTSSRENTERVPISPISPKGEVPKPWEGPCFPYFPYFGGPCLDRMNRHWPPKIGEILTLSWFWHFIKGKHWEGP